MALELRGLAVPYEIPSTRLDDGRRTVFRRGAFTRCLGEYRRVPVCVSHRKETRLAEFCGLHEGRAGLFFACTVTDPTWTALLTSAVELRCVRGVSISHKERTARVEIIGDLYVVHEATLTEVSICLNGVKPAFVDTYVEIFNS